MDCSVCGIRTTKSCPCGTRYCSQNCQKEDLQNHKVNCSAFAARATLAAIAGCAAPLDQSWTTKRQRERILDVFQIQEIGESLGLSLPPTDDTVFDMTLTLIGSNRKELLMRVEFLNDQKAVLIPHRNLGLRPSLWKAVDGKLALCEEFLPPGLGFACDLPWLGNAWAAVYNAAGGDTPSPLYVEIRVEKSILRHRFPERRVRPVIVGVPLADHRGSYVFGAAALSSDRICIGYTGQSGSSELIVLKNPENLETSTVEVIEIPSPAEFCTGMSTVSSFGAEYLFLTTYDALIVLRFRGGILELTRLYLEHTIGQHKNHTLGYSNAMCVTPIGDGKFDVKCYQAVSQLSCLVDLRDANDRLSWVKRWF